MLSVDGNFVEVPITNGVGVYQYTNTQIGKNVTISGYFEENPTKGYLKSNTESTEFEVLKLGTDIAITNSSDVTAHKEATATVTLTHDGQPVSGEVLNVVIKDEYDNKKIFSNIDKYY
jgi:c-di-GMP-binding flagellar brake protein YcgR